MAYNSKASTAQVIWQHLTDVATMMLPVALNLLLLVVSLLVVLFANMIKIPIWELKSLLLANEASTKAINLSLLISKETYCRPQS